MVKSQKPRHSTQEKPTVIIEHNASANEKDKKIEDKIIGDKKPEKKGPAPISTKKSSSLLLPIFSGFLGGAFFCGAYHFLSPQHLPKPEAKVNVASPISLQDAGLEKAFEHFYEKKLVEHRLEDFSHRLSSMQETVDISAQKIAQLEEKARLFSEGNPVSMKAVESSEQVEIQKSSPNAEEKKEESGLNGDSSTIYVKAGTLDAQITVFEEALSQQKQMLQKLQQEMVQNSTFSHDNAGRLKVLEQSLEKQKENIQDFHQNLLKFFTLYQFVTKVQQGFPFKEELQHLQEQSISVTPAASFASYQAKGFKTDSQLLREFEKFANDLRRSFREQSVPEDISGKLWSNIKNLVTIHKRGEKEDILENKISFMHEALINHAYEQFVQQAQTISADVPKELAQTFQDLCLQLEAKAAAQHLLESTVLSTLSQSTAQGTGQAEQQGTEFPKQSTP